MIISTERYTLRSKNDNLMYWEQDIYPAWTALNCYQHFPNGASGTGVEPHYHDCDELWLFTTGRGEVWLNGEKHDITPNTMVYTPMGCVHRFQMFTPYENNAIVTPLERARRPTHVTVEVDGPPTPTVPGFVVSGSRNTGPIDGPGQRCPLTEWRQIELPPGGEIGISATPVNEHWLVLAGTVTLQLDDGEMILSPHDVALLRAGTRRRLAAPDGARVIVARERA